jgi:hypothetical protein
MEEWRQSKIAGGVYGHMSTQERKVQKAVGYRRRVRPLCKYHGCTTPGCTNGYCTAHYTALKKTSIEAF